MDLDPRDSDSRDDERHSLERDRGHRPSPDQHRDWDDSRQPQDRERDDQGRELGRGPGDDSRRSETERHGRDDPRWPDRDGRDREMDPRDVFTRDLYLPRGHEREHVYDPRDRGYTLRGSESRTLSTVGAFRVVSARDLRDHDGRAADPRTGDLRHLREQGLIRTERLQGHREPVVVLTDRGRDLLNVHRLARAQEPRQQFYARLVKPREVEHDAQIYRAYLREAEKLAERHARIERVVLDYELKREYQQWLHARDAERDSASGRPDRDPSEVQEWAYEHDLPYFDEQVHFPDLRIEYRDAADREDHLDVEVLTVHYRGGHGAAAARSGFSSYRGSSGRIGGRGGRGHNGGLAEELWR